MSQDNPNDIHVLKSDGSSQLLDYNKLNKMAEYAAQGLEDVSASEIAMNAKLHIVDGITTQEIQTAITDSAHDLISDITPGYQYAAARLFLVTYYKEVLGGHEHPHLATHIQSCVSNGVYDTEFMTQFNYDEMNELNDYIDYQRDFLFAYAGIRKVYDTYAIQNRTNGKRYETPQQLYMAMAMGSHIYEPKDVRLQHIKEAYDVLSLFDLSEPTPIMAGVRGTVKQYASCAKIQSGDNLRSISASSSAASIYGAKRAGLGIDAGRIRAVDSKVGDGSTSHTGVLPFLKYFYAAQASCSQGGLRKTSSTIFYPIWHLEFENLIVLKNNRGTEETRLRHADYGVKLNKVFYKRLFKGENITLFSPHDVPELYEAFHRDTSEFEVLYKEAESNPNIRKKVLKASEVFTLLAGERNGTGRIYIMNIDHANEHSAFNAALAPVYQSNLCLTGDTKTTAIVNGSMIEGLTLLELNELYNSGTSDIKVLSKNLETEESEFKKVQASALTKKNAKLMRITDDETGKSIRCTPEHKVYTKNRGYVEAKNLKHDDVLDLK